MSVACGIVNTANRLVMGEEDLLNLAGDASFFQETEESMPQPMHHLDELDPNCIG